MRFSRSVKGKIKTQKTINEKIERESKVKYLERHIDK
jgi:hypothetical protein